MNRKRDSMLVFTKMHGLGNDFIVVDNTAGDTVLDADRVRRLADRHTGIGFDQLLVVEAPSRADAALDYRIYNADGGEVEHCGNGARCFARFVHDRGLIRERRFIVNTQGGLIELTLLDDGRVTVGMGTPTFEAADVPFVPDAGGADVAVTETKDAHPLASGQHRLDVDGDILQVGVVGLGNPHVVVPVSNVDSAPVATLGPRLECDPRFPARVNVGFVERVDASRIRLRVHERGVGETRACGTGACAAVVVGQQQGLLDRRVIVSLSGGELDIFHAGGDAVIEMTGPCSTVFEGHTRM